MFANSGTPTNGMTIARLARVAAAIARFASPKASQAGGPPGASAYYGTCQGRPSVDSIARPSGGGQTKPLGDDERAPAPFHAVLVWIWVGLLLLIVGYAIAEGEHVLAKLDTLKVLAAYSTGVRRFVRPDLAAPAAAVQPRQSSSATRVP
jgi:hypothetical protein